MCLYSPGGYSCCKRACCRVSTETLRKCQKDTKGRSGTPPFVDIIRLIHAVLVAQRVCIESELLRSRRRNTFSRDNGSVYEPFFVEQVLVLMVLLLCVTYFQGHACVFFLCLESLSVFPYLSPLTCSLQLCSAVQGVDLCLYLDLATIHSGSCNSLVNAKCPNPSLHPLSLPKFV